MSDLFLEHLAEARARGEATWRASYETPEYLRARFWFKDAIVTAVEALYAAGKGAGSEMHIPVPKEIPQEDLYQVLEREQTFKAWRMSHELAHHPLQLRSVKFQGLHRPLVCFLKNGRDKVTEAYGIKVHDLLWNEGLHSNTVVAKKNDHSWNTMTHFRVTPDDVAEGTFAVYDSKTAILTTIWMEDLLALRENRILIMTMPEGV